MTRYITDRLLYTGLILFFVSILIFVLARLLPGDPIQAVAMMNGDLLDSRILDDLRSAYDLDKPLYVQYAAWIKKFILGDWGVSIGSGERVFSMFFSRLPVTLELFAGSVFWTVLIGFPVGIISVLRRNSWLDTFLTTVSILGISIPVFWEGIVLIFIFAVTMHVLPPSGYVPFAENPWMNLQSVLLPTFVMGTQGAGIFARYVRAGFLDVLGQDYIRTARAKGLSEQAVILFHAAKPAMVPVLTVAGLVWSHVVAGSFLVEYIFAIPGLGRMGVDAVFARDFPVIQATVIMVAANVLLVNLLVDLLYGWLDPRIRIG